METREQFESELQKEFEQRNVESWGSIGIFNIAFTVSEKSEKELDEVEQSLFDKDFDAILFTKITGSEDCENFIKTISRWDDNDSHFNDDYLEHQGIYCDETY